MAMISHLSLACSLLLAMMASMPSSTTAFTTSIQRTSKCSNTLSSITSTRTRSMIIPFFPSSTLSIVQQTTKMSMSSSWDDFSYDDDDELLDSGVDSEFVAADENDDASVKAAAGASLEAPEVDWFGEVIDVPQGSQLELDEETVQGVLAACRQEIGTMFGYQAENRGVGITGGVDFVELDGPTVVLHLKGRFWHTRPMVLTRVGNYLMSRIPEIVDVVVEDDWELTDEANDLAAGL